MERQKEVLDKNNSMFHGYHWHYTYTIVSELEKAININHSTQFTTRRTMKISENLENTCHSNQWTVSSIEKKTEDGRWTHDHSCGGTTNAGHENVLFMLRVTSKVRGQIILNLNMYVCIISLLLLLLLQYLLYYYVGNNTSDYWPYFLCQINVSKGTELKAAPDQWLLSDELAVTGENADEPKETWFFNIMPFISRSAIAH